MKTKSLLIYVGIAIAFAGYIYLSTYNFSTTSSDYKSYQIFPNEVDSLEQSTQQAKNAWESKKYELQKYLTGIENKGGFTFGTWGVHRLETKANSSLQADNYLFLPGIGLKNQGDKGSEDMITYQMKNGQPFIITKKIIKNRQNHLYEQHYFTKVEYLYDATDNGIYLPLHSNFSLFGIYIIGILHLIILFISFLYGSTNFIKFLIRIAQAKVFMEENVTLLRNIFVATLILNFSVPICNILTYLIVIFNHEQRFLSLEFANGNGVYRDLTTTLLFFLLYFAFKRGNRLQQEAELTI